MSLKMIIHRFGKMSSEKQAKEQQPYGGRQCVCWPLPEPIPVSQFLPPLFGDEKSIIQDSNAGGNRPNEDTAIKVFQNPIMNQEIVNVFDARAKNASECFPPDSKCCVVVNEAGELRYVACRSYINAIQKFENSMGGSHGIKVLRMLALDRFGYKGEFETLYLEEERERGQAPAAMGYARILLGHCHTARALEVVESALGKGLRGAALSACHARTLFECRRIQEGVSAAADAIVQLPDPLWMEADDDWTWGLLRGAAEGSREDSTLREVVISAIQAIRHAASSPECLLACASLAESIGHFEEVCQCAEATTKFADCNKTTAKEAEEFRSRSCSLSAISALLNQSLNQISDVRRVKLGISGWVVKKLDSDARNAFWKNEHGDELSLTIAPKIELPPDAGDEEVKRFCRRLAEENSAGLVQAGWILGQLGRTIQLIYKHPKGFGFTFSGFQIVPFRNASLQWKALATELGTTGVREATITKQMFDQGRMTLEGYEKFWAADPFDLTYSGVEHKTLRYFSDDIFFDSLFPDHPLSRLRRILRDLCTNPNWDFALTRH